MNTNQQCECSLEEIEQNFLEKLKESHPKETLSLEGYNYGLQNKAYMMGAGKICLYSELKYEYTFTKKDGTQSAPKTRTCSIYHNYCSFCGKPYKAESES